MGSLVGRPAVRLRPRGSAAAQVGARRAAHVGKRAAGRERQAGSRGSAPSSPPLPGGRRGSSRRAAPAPVAPAAPAAAALPRLLAARRGCSLARRWRLGRPGLPPPPPGQPAGAGRRGEPGVGGGQGGGWAPWEGERERASERAGHFCAARVRLGARPGGRRTHGPRTDSARKPRRRCQVSRPRRPPPGPRGPRSVCCRVCLCARLSPRTPGSDPGPRALTGRRTGSRRRGAGGGWLDAEGLGAGAPVRSPGPLLVSLGSGAGTCGGGSTSPSVGCERACARGSVQVVVVAVCVRVCAECASVFV